MFDTIEKLKQQFTDQYVEVAADVPELARFGGITGQVKTVNMSGRALVEFPAWNNIGWYDIDVDFLKIVPKPDPAAAKAEHAAPAAKKAAPAKPAATAAGEKKMSVAEMARAQGSAKAPAAAGGAPAKKSVAEILAAARANKPAAGGAATAAPAAEPEAEPAPVDEAPGPKTPMAPAKKPAGGLPTTTAERIAWLRANDSKK